MKLAPHKPAFLPTRREATPRYPVLTLGARGFGVLFAFSVGLGLDAMGIGYQLGLALHYLASIVMSLLISYAGVLLAVNVGFALAWLLLPFRWASLPKGLAAPYAWFYDVLTFFNRQIGHIEGTVLWVLAVFAYVESVTWQFGLVATLLLLAEPILDTIAVLAVSFEDREQGARPSRDHESLRTVGAIHWARRPLINVATFVGAGFIIALAPEQLDKSAGFVLAMAAGAFLRLAKWGRRHLEYRRDAKHSQAGLAGEREVFRETHVKRWGRIDTPLLLICAPVLLGWAFAFQQERRVELADSTKDQVWSERPLSCVTDPGPALDRADISIFVLADSQFHDLAGPRFAGEMAIADALVPVAQRPVELQILAPAALLSLAKYRDTLDASAAALPWVYLGDFADLACVTEMERIVQTLGAFDFDASVGVAPGNHDSSFTGNFAWSPHWRDVCDERLDKSRSDQLLAAAFRTGIEQHGGTLESVRGDLGWKSWIRGFQRGQALVGVTPLGVTKLEGEARAVIGVFLDTADQIDFDLGVSGIVGTLSDVQVDAVVARVDELTHNDPYKQALYVLFSHHPINALNKSAKQRLSRLVSTLDGSEPRVIGVVSAHTHRAKKQANQCVGGRRLDDLVVGSTIDAPQEGALLEIGSDADGRVTMSVTTIPVVSRPELTCMAPSEPSALACKQLVAQLNTERSCHALLRREDGAVGEDCGKLAVDAPLRGRLGTISGAPEFDQLLAAQRLRATHLFECLCRGDRCDPPTDPMVDDQHFTLINELAGVPGGATELACMSWAAAAVSAHGANGMEMADALRCAFDDVSVQPARRMTTRLGARACH